MAMHEAPHTKKSLSYKTSDFKLLENPHGKSFTLIQNFRSYRFQLKWLDFAHEISPSNGTCDHTITAKVWYFLKMTIVNSIAVNHSFMSHVLYHRFVLFSSYKSSGCCFVSQLSTVLKKKSKDYGKLRCNIVVLLFVLLQFCIHCNRL